MGAPIAEDTFGLAIDVIAKVEGMVAPATATMTRTMIMFTLTSSLGRLRLGH